MKRIITKSKSGTGCLDLPRIAVVLVALLVFCGSICEDKDPYLSNPNLVLLLKKEGHCLFNPVPAPNGRLIYFLDDSAPDTQNPPTSFVGGDLHVFNLADSSDRLLLQGLFLALALSRDGQKIALLSSRYRRDTLEAFITDTAGTTVDTVLLPHPGEEWGVRSDLAFLSSGERVVFSVWMESRSRFTSFISKGLGHDTGTVLIDSVPWAVLGFDVFDSDSIYADSVATGYPSVNPQNSRWAVFASEEGLFGSCWLIHDRQKEKFNALGSETHPYRIGYVEWPCWTADGRDLVFSTAAYTNGEIASLELWLLRDALAGHR